MQRLHQKNKNKNKNNTFGVLIFFIRICTTETRMNELKLVRTPSYNKEAEYSPSNIFIACDKHIRASHTDQTNFEPTSYIINIVSLCF